MWSCHQIRPSTNGLFIPGFIDADDDVVPEDFSHRRSSSLPPLKLCEAPAKDDEFPTPELFMQEYVENLSQQLQTKTVTDARSKFWMMLLGICLCLLR